MGSLTLHRFPLNLRAELRSAIFQEEKGRPRRVSSLGSPSRAPRPLTWKLCTASSSGSTSWPRCSPERSYTTQMGVLSSSQYSLRGSRCRSHTPTSAPAPAAAPHAATAPAGSRGPGAGWAASAATGRAPALWARHAGLRGAPAAGEAGAAEVMAAVEHYRLHEVLQARGAGGLLLQALGRGP